MPDSPERRLTAYFQELERALAGVSPQERQEILSDLRSLVEEERERSIPLETTLERLGTPQDLAARYHPDAVQASQASPSPDVPPRFSQRLRAPFLGLVAALVSILGYSLALGFILSALWKPFHPDQVGVYWNPPLITLGHTGSNQGELLGYWIIPVGLLLGGILFRGTWRAVQWLSRHKP